MTVILGRYFFRPALILLPRFFTPATTARKNTKRHTKNETETERLRDNRTLRQLRGHRNQHEKRPTQTRKKRNHRDRGSTTDANRTSNAWRNCRASGAQSKPYGATNPHRQRRRGVPDARGRRFCPRARRPAGASAKGGPRGVGGFLAGRPRFSGVLD